MALKAVPPRMDAQGRPYFLWSEDLSDEMFRSILRGDRGPELQALYTGRLLREARMAEVWWYLKPQDIADRWPEVARHLGRARQFWHELLEAWREAGRVSWQP
ncbi:MAG: hypothetical protein AB7S38_39145 [Vulcanimicrobiota bacterium]